LFSLNKEWLIPRTSCGVIRPAGAFNRRFEATAKKCTAQADKTR
jgi:hypothetical protein